MKNEIRSIGLDVHAKNITVALAEGGGVEARTHGLRRGGWGGVGLSRLHSSE